jgi:hypothetical protein
MKARVPPMSDMPETTKREGLHPVIWVTVLSIFIAALLWFFAA